MVQITPLHISSKDSRFFLEMCKHQFQKSNCEKDIMPYENRAARKQNDEKSSKVKMMVLLLFNPYNFLTEGS